MKTTLPFLLLAAALASCLQKTGGDAAGRPPLSVAGTWRLITGTVIQKNDTVVTDYTTNRSFVKIINGTHFAFLHHDLAKGKDTAAVFSAGGGRYSLQDGVYTERLEYCSDRNWEGHDFAFTVTLQGDTLVQRGIEQVESAGIDRTNIEKYVRLNP